MKTKILIFTVVVLLVTTVFIQLITGQTADISSSGTSAQQALNTFKKLVTAENYKNYGLKSVDAIQQTTLGDAIEIFYVWLDDLKVYEAGQNGGNLIKSQNRVIYPILSSGSAISSAELEHVNGKWEARSFGRANAIQAYSDNVIKWRADSVQNTFLLRIPSLALEFYASHVGAKTYLVYTGSEQITDIPNDKIMLLEDVLLKLKPIAVEYNGLPR